MLERIAQASRLILIPTGVLYLLGFLCLTAYLSRFGIVNFDILNARYLIAGFFPLLGIAASVALSFYFRERIIALELVTLRNSTKRHVGYAIFLISVHLISSTLNALFSFGQYHEPSKQTTLKDAVLGNFDAPGRLFQHVRVETDFAELAKITLHLAFYTFLLVLVIWLIAHLVVASRLKVVKEDKPSEQAPVIESSAPLPKISRLRKILIVAIESLFWSFLAVLFFYSQRRLRAALFDFGSFDGAYTLDSGITFAWFYVLMLGTFLIIGLLPRDLTKILDASELKKLINPNSLWNLGFLVIIPFLASSFAFGAAIFPRIPFAIGGGEPREATLEMLDRSIKLEADQIFLLGESAQFIYAVAINDGNARALQINKDAIAYIETKKRTLLLADPESGAPD